MTGTRIRRPMCDYPTRFPGFGVPFLCEKCGHPMRIRSVGEVPKAYPKVQFR